jgi:O-antigen biosynthesis protein WbqP
VKLLHGTVNSNLPKPATEVVLSPVSSADSLKRLFDIAVSVLLLFILCLPMALIALLIRLESRGPATHWSDRIGLNNRVFKMPKFRTMRLGAPAVATHLFEDPGRWVTPIGRVLRKFSLDELPQLFSVLKGDMSFVGPRPALFNQDDLVALRTQKGIHRLVPGITGWAQINGRDGLPIPLKVRYEEEYLKRRSFAFDVKILSLTVARVFDSKGISH